jgi:2-polyprenyl-3-methyl-5-hydroxy-6-metoxy-1,4-benzoquinol methylase
VDYEEKADNYFNAARSDFINMLPDNPEANILEVGCGFGETGSMALHMKKCAAYTGIELSDRAAIAARQKLTRVLHGDVETMAIDFPPQHFDALILSEVLEHLIDPWAVLRKLNPIIKKGGMVLASSPNVSHHSMVRRLLRGDWKLADSGVMDRTHLRWFTPKTYCQLFEETGFVVRRVGPVRSLGTKARLVDNLTGKRFTHLFMNQISIWAEKSG